jgi:prophage tail gpP-like protein
MSEVLLKVSGRQYSGWKEVHIEKSLEAICGAFEVALADTSPLDKSQWPLKMGDVCTLYIDNALILTGYIEDINLAYGAGMHEIRIAGRDKTGDLVDCYRGGDAVRMWENQTVAQLVRNLCQPFGISVVVQSSAAVSAAKQEVLFTANEGDTVFESIRRLCYKHHVVPMTHGDGILRLTKNGTSYSYDRIETGLNVLRGTLTQSNRERFSDYFSKGIGFSFDTAESKMYLRPSGDARDSLIRRYRPYVFLEETNVLGGDCKNRAKAEAAFRAGKSRTLEYDVPGWLQSNGEPWYLNSLVQVRDDVLGMNGSWLLDAIRHVVSSEQGSITTLGLVSPEKYKAQAELQKTATEFDALFAALAQAQEQQEEE